LLDLFFLEIGFLSWFLPHVGRKGDAHIIEDEIKSAHQSLSKLEEQFWKNGSQVQPKRCDVM